jgi:hypothetical protein
VELLVEHEAPAGGLRDQLDGAVVVCRPEPPGDETEVGLEALSQCRLELVPPVADNRDPRWLESERQRLGGEERAVEVGSLAANQLAAGDDDRGPRP